MKTRKQINSRFHRAILISSITCLMFGSAAVQADDIEIYLTTPPEPVAPNVLFVLDESGSMSSGTPSRLDDLKNALINDDPDNLGILQDPAYDNFNAAILAYTLGRDNDAPGRPYKDSIRAISDFVLIGENRNSMVTAVDGLRAASGTPSVKALADAVGWFESGFADTGFNIAGTDGDYESPLAGDEEGNWCKPNAIIFMTDGRPNSNNPLEDNDNIVWATWAISEYSVADDDSDPANDAIAACDNSERIAYITNDEDNYEHKGGLCAGEIARWANNTDLKDWQEKQNITIHTVGLDIGDGTNEEDFLVNMATEGGGDYYPASDAASLRDAFISAFDAAGTSIQYSYSSPTIPYNPDNSAVSDNFIYVPSFRPLASKYWKGNLKKYRITEDSFGDIQILDRNGANVVNSDFSFATNTQDYWTSEANSGETYLGGAVSNMSGSTERRLYTWLDDNPLTTEVDPLSKDLTATIVATDPITLEDVTINPNRVYNENIIITADMVDADSANDRSEYLNWANWIGDALIGGEQYTRNDSFPVLDTTAGTTPDGLREYMGAPIHTTPLVTRYNSLRFTDDDTVVDGANNSIDLGIANPWSNGDLVVYKGPGLTLQVSGSLVNDVEYKVITGSGTAIQLAFKEDEGDPLTPIDLADSSNTGGQHSFTGSDAIDVVLMATSEGVLHAFDGGSDTVDTPAGDGGDELWSFMPSRFLENIKELRANGSADTPEYGLDGPLAIYESGDKKYVAMTMRRGGRDIYVLDITDINKPKMAWEIIGGTTTGFERLGQTWSEIQFLRMELNGAEARDVLVFGGGYDTKQDPSGDPAVIPISRQPDDMGNAIYVVDPATGERLAYFSADTTTDPAVNSLQVTGMENGIIGILPVDINNNGIIERLYASGVGGRIFRIDIPDNKTEDLDGLCDKDTPQEGYDQCVAIKGGMIADINSDPGNSGFQRFFNKPEVAYYNRGGVTFLGILIGSGYRPSPLDNTVTDRFYMIKDFDAFTVPDSYSTITEGGLYDATANLIQESENILAPLESALYTCLEAAVDEGLVGSVNDGLLPNSDVCESEKDAFYAQKDVVDGHKADLAAKSGWFIDLLEGDIKQKVFSEARIFESVILFSTYQGERGNQADVCLATQADGQSKIYALSLLDGSAVLDLSNANIDLDGGTGGTGGESEGVVVINSADRSIGLSTQGLPPAPVIVFPDPGTGEVSLSGRKAVALVGLESVFRFPDRFFPVNWEEIIDTGITPAQ